MFEKRLVQCWDNEAAWVYLRGLYEVTSEQTTNKLSKVKRVPLNELTADLKPRLEPLGSNRFALMCLADIAQVENDLQRKIDIYQSLRDTHDRIRRNYWQFLLNQI